MPQTDPTPAAPPRLDAVDLARTAAIIGMVAFHFARDLEDFGIAPAGMTATGLWPWFARAVAGSFLFLSGVSLVLAARGGLDRRRYLVRLAQIAAAAALVSIATRLAVPQAWVFFGILHMMAAATLIGPLFLRLPSALTLAAAAFALAAPFWLRAPLFDAPWLVWTGLATYIPLSIDFVPFLPWAAPYLAGHAAARIALPHLRPAPSRAPARWHRVLAWPGRHSLAIYLIHQPVLIGLLWFATQL
jgi:uncharacterized membrane protein